jgi:hypothetical protein
MSASTINRKRSGRTSPRKTEAKKLVKGALGKYYCLRTRDLAYLLKSDNPTADDLRSINYTLKLLREEGYVCRSQIILNGKTDQRSFPFVYGLTDKAVRELGEGQSFEECRTAQHQLALSIFRIDLEDWCETKSWELYWQQSDLKHTIHPDAYFRITTDKGKYHFFLEEERQKPSHKKQFKKWATYYEYYNSDLCMKEWNFRQFRVVIPELTEERVKRLVSTLAETPLHESLCHWYPPYNKKCDCKPFLANHRMFWVTSDERIKEGIGTKIFTTPKHDQFSFLDIQN